MVVVVGAAVAAGFLLGSSSDTSTESAPATTTAPNPEPEPTSVPATAATPAVDPEIERRLVAAEDGIPLIVSDYGWQNPELFEAFKRQADAMTERKNLDCSYFSSDEWNEVNGTRLKLRAVEASAVAEIDALADEVSALRRTSGEVGERAFQIHNVLRHEASRDVRRITYERTGSFGAGRTRLNEVGMRNYLQDQC